MVGQRLSERTRREAVDIHRVYRKTARAKEGMVPPDSIPGNFFVRLFRTFGDNPGDPNDASYPSQVDGDGARLPGRMVKVTYDAGASDPVTVAPLDDGPNYIYSPFGWLPRLTDVFVALNSGLFVPIEYPEFFVTASSITAGAAGTVTMVKSGAANGQTFSAWLDHMDGGTNISSLVEAFAWLHRKEKKWYITNRSC